MARLRQTLSDYVAIGISPALIVFMVASFTLYLSEVFYQGGFGHRINFILCMFVMGAVSIGRISIEEGTEYAALYGIFLAAATGLAVFCLVSPPLPGFILIGVIWYATHKLTWDCTVVIESEDASGEGLLQTAGIDGGNRPQEPKPETAAELLAAEAAQHGGTDLEATSGEHRQPEEPKTLWEKWVAYRRRPHAHGLWVIYFSIAALPIFGVGQWFLRSDDTSSRSYCFRLLLVYVACALSLLMTTSFLSLRRYLRQRRLQMPVEMTAAWFTSGGLMVVALLLVCSLLPRRNPIFSMAEEFQDSSFYVTSKTGIRSSDYAMMNSDALDDADSGSGQRGEGESDGQRRQDAKRSGGPDAKSGAASSGEQRGGKQSGGKQGGGKQGGGKQGGGKQSGGKQSGGKQGGGKQSGGKQGGGKQGGGKQGGGKQGGGKQSGGKQGGGKQGGGKQGGEASDSKGDSAKQGGRGSEGDDGKQQRQGSEKAAQFDQGQRNRNRSSNPTGSQRNQSQDTGKRPDDRETREKQNASKAGPSKRSSPPPQSRSGNSSWLSTLGAGFRALLKLIYYVAIFALVGYFAWRYREQVVEAIRQFIAKLRELWERLFGGRESTREEEAPEQEAAQSRLPSFREFEDPFLSGAFRQLGADRVTRLTFQAFQAWARDQGVARGQQQTPIEFAASVAREYPELQDEARVLADTYCRLAYARQSTPAEAMPPMKSLWEKMQRLYGVEVVA